MTSRQAPLADQLNQLFMAAWRLCPDEGLRGMTRDQFAHTLKEHARRYDRPTVQGWIRELNRLRRESGI